MNKVCALLRKSFPTDLIHFGAQPVKKVEPKQPHQYTSQPKQSPRMELAR